MLAQRSTIDFYILILYCEILLNLFVSSNRFFFGKFCRFMSSVNRDTFTFPFPLWMPCFVFVFFFFLPNTIG